MGCKQNEDPVEDPILELAGGATEISVPAVGGSNSFIYEVTNPVDDGRIEAVSSEGWIDNFTYDEENVSFIVEANEETEPRTSVVTVTYVYGTDKSVSATVDIVQQGYTEDVPDAVALDVPVPEFGTPDGTSVTVSWTAVENAASYTYVFNNGSETSVSETSVTVELVEGNNTFRVKAVPENGSTEYVESDWSETIEYTYGVAPQGGIESWYGTYTVTSSYGISASGTTGVTINRVDEPVTFEFTISEYPYNEPGSEYTYAYITGWSRWASAGIEGWQGESMSGLVQMSSDGSQLYFLTDVSVGTLSENSNGEPIDGVWLTMGYAEGYGYTTITRTGYGLIFTKNGDNYTLETPPDSELSDGTVFSFETVEIFGSDEYYTYFFNLPYTMPAGEFTLVKTSSSAPAAAPAFSFNANMMKSMGAKLYGPLPSVSVLR